jgi:hypothetical protein
MINAKLQNIIDTKSAIGNAIVNKGGTITSETPFFNYAAQIDGISTGTPQTIFAASDGSKWALTNAVNLVNDAGNVTSDFNYWQPANNSTSDPILNVGTVGANISGNIQLVQVNEVNIAQFENIVINDTTGAKYVGYNGFDANTNPTPTGNTTFNRWLLNNSATGTVVFANSVITNAGIYNGPNGSLNITNMAFINNTAAYGGDIRSITTNNGFIFVGGFGDTANGKVQKFYESNLARENNSAVYAVGYIINVAVNNGFVYVGGYGPSFGAANVSKYHESNLAFVGNTASYGGLIYSITTNNGFIYVGGSSNQTVQKFHESNLVRVGNTASYGGVIFSVTTNNGFIYAGGSTNNTVQKFYESNLAFVGNTPSYGADINSITISNGFIYVGGAGNATANRDVKKYYESNLAFINNTASYGAEIVKITNNGGFIYVGGFGNQIKKYHESNLVFVGNTANYGGGIFGVTTNDGFIYVGGGTNETVQKFQEQEVTFDNQTFYTITNIKE